MSLPPRKPTARIVRMDRTVVEDRDSLRAKDRARRKRREEEREQNKAPLSAAHKASAAQEQRLATTHGGRRTRGSGNQIEKGDVRVPGLLRIEAKSTQAKSYSLTREDLAKIEGAACNAGEVPMMQVDFLDAGGKIISSVYVVPAWAMEGGARDPS